jgi:hypothetical protein
VDAGDRARPAPAGERWSVAAGSESEALPTRTGTGPYHQEGEGFEQPMTADFQTVLAANDEERRDLFVGAADRLRTNEQNIEKDFWVCWTLDALFNELDAGGPRLLFKGGTSLSKGYGLIERFSEDIDITVFREDIGQPTTVKELETLSGKKRNARLESIKTACQKYIQGPMLEQLSTLLRQTFQTANLNADRARVEADPDDPDGQSLLLWYPTATAEGNAYIRRAIKIESGAKSALDPHAPVVVKPYIADDLPNLDLAVGNVTTVDPSRTFWDKVVILHGLRRWWDRRGELRGGGQRVSRHYYDVYRLLASETGRKATDDAEMAEDCVRHARMFFTRPDLDLASAISGSFALTPHDGMLAALRRDYEAMSGMVFGPIPTIDAVVAEIAELEHRLNQRH